MKLSNILLILLVAVAVFSCLSGQALPKEIILFGFEKDPQGWEVPDWAQAKRDHVAHEISMSEFQASEGKYALEVGVDFTADPGWEGAYIERYVDVTDWSPFKYLSVDMFLPKEAPRGLRARIILTVGEEWKWTEMNRSIPLTPGEWVVLKADISPDSLNWRRFVNESFRSDVRKLGIRVESNGNVAYKGPVYIDNIKLAD